MEREMNRWAWKWWWKVFMWGFRKMDSANYGDLFWLLHTGDSIPQHSINHAKEICEIVHCEEFPYSQIQIREYCQRQAARNEKSE